MMAWSKVLTGAALALAAPWLVLSAPAEVAAQDEGTIEGRTVFEGTDEPVSGVQVSIADTDIGTLTDAEGMFSLLNVPAGDVTLEVQVIGFEDKTTSVSVAADETVEVVLELTDEPLGLDDVVVTGQAGGAERREIGNVVSGVRLDELDQPAGNMDDLLSGRVSSMTVNPGSGTMGAGAQIRIRGNVSATGSNQPLIYVDGVRQGADAYPPNASSGGPFHQQAPATASPLNEINPEDIENIEVVKGSAATTMYGSEAAAGVIQIFTRQGQEGDARWSYRMNQRMDRVQSFGSDTRPYGYMGDDGVEEWGWDEPLLQRGWTQEHNLSVQGGRDDINYYISGRFDDGRGVHLNDEQTRYSIRGNFGLTPFDDFSLTWNTAYNNDDLTITHTGNNVLAPQFSAYRAPGGTVAPEAIPDLLDAAMFQENSRFNTSLSGTWTPRGNITQEFTVGLDRMDSEMVHDTPYGLLLAPDGNMAEMRWLNQSISLEYIGGWDFGITESLGSSLSWGAQNVTTEERMVDGWGEGFPGPGNHTLNAAAVNLAHSSGERTIDAGGFLENRFNLHDRYWLTAGVRVDGNSTFGDDLGLQVYPKTSLSWMVSDETFWRDQWGDFRLRGAIGEAGRAPGPFDAVRTFSAFSYAGESAFLPANIGNPDLGPERSREFEGGFESSLFNGRLQVDFNAYHQQTRDALLSVGQVPSSGFIGSQLENVGEIENRGIELELNSTVYEGPQYSLDVGANLSTNRSEVLETGEAESSSIVKGQPVPVMQGNKITNPDEFADPEVESDHYYGPNQPTRTLGLNTTVGLPYGMRLTARGEGQFGHYIGQGAQSSMVDRGAGAFPCEDAYEIVPYDGYQDASESDLSQVTALDRGRCYPDNLQSGFWTEPADFFKLRELTLSAPVDFALPMVDSATFTLSARNIRLWTNDEFTGFDPEMISSRAGLTALTSGITETTPSPMQFTASVRVEF